MIKLNHNNRYVKALCKQLFKSTECYLERVSVKDEVHYRCKGFKIVTDWEGNVKEVWQLSDCKDPVIKI